METPDPPRTAGGSAAGSNGNGNGSRSRTSTRKFHHKGRTGCRTCRVRRVRCDEQRPSCNRCTSTGRRCDGYATDPSYLTSFTFLNSSSRPSSNNVKTLAPCSEDNDDNASPGPHKPVDDDRSLLNHTAIQKLYFLRSDPDEIRSFRYFMQISGPAIAGSFNTRFWTEELPRACYHDPAVWHAVISLSSVYEDHVALSRAGRTHQPYRNTYALDHFNKSIRHLLEQKDKESGSGVEDKWRAVVLSTIFTALCLVEGLYDQAKMHFKSGCTIYNEIIATNKLPSSSSLPAPPPSSERDRNNRLSDQRIPPTGPMSVLSMRSVLAGLEIWTHGINQVSRATSIICPDDKAWYLWETYTAPTREDQNERLLTADKLKAASRAAQSLLNAHFLFTWEHRAELEQLVLNPSVDVVNSLTKLQTPLINRFKQLHKAMCAFESELEDNSEKRRESDTKEMAALRLGFHVLTLYVAANRLFIMQSLETYSLHDKLKTYASASSYVVDAAEAILAAEAGKPSHGATPMAPLPALVPPISVVINVAPDAVTRVRALNIFKSPRTEGYLDGVRMAILSQAIMAAEAASSAEYSDGVPPGQGSIAIKLGEHLPIQGREVHPLSRCYAANFISGKRGEGKVYVRTWRDYMNNSDGKTVSFTW